MLAPVEDGIEVRAGVATIGNARLDVIQQQVVGIFNFVFIGKAIPGCVEIVIGFNLPIEGVTWIYSKLRPMFF